MKDPQGKNFICLCDEAWIIPHGHRCAHCKYTDSNHPHYYDLPIFYADRSYNYALLYATEQDMGLTL